MQATLRVLNGSRAGARYTLRPEPATIGRAAGATVVLDDPQAAEQHASLFCDGAAWHVCDTSGEPGTYVNGARIADWTALKTGDSLRLGRTILAFECAAAVAAPEALDVLEPVAVEAVAAAPAPPRTGPVGSGPRSGPIAAPPRTGPVSAGPRSGPVSAGPRSGPVSTAPRTGPVSAAPRTGPVNVAPRTGPVAAAPRTGPVSGPVSGPAAAGAAAPADGARAARGKPAVPDCDNLEQIGQGVTCTTWKGRQTVHARDVAVRVLDGPIDRSALARRVAQQVGTLAHPSLVRVHDVGTWESVPFVVMEFVGGGSLADRIRREGGLPWRDAVRIGAQVAAALGHAHEKSLVHGAVTPWRVFMGRQGQVKLGELGPLVRPAVDPAAEGGPHFLSPEQLRGEEATYESDVWCLGAIVYYALTGTAPDPAAGIAPLETLSHGVPDRVRETITAMLADDPAARPAGIGEIGRRLAGSIVAADARRDLEKKGAKKSSVRKGMLVAAAVLAGVAGLCYAVTGGFGSDEDETAGETDGGRGAQMSEAARRYAAIRAKETALGMMVASNLGALRDVAREYGALGVEFSIDDPAVGQAWGRRREILCAVSAVDGEPDVFSRDHVDIWLRRVTEDRSDPTAGPRAVRGLDAGMLAASRDAATAAAETSLDQDRYSEGFGAMAAWVATAKAQAKAAKSGDAEWAEIMKGVQWLRTAALGVTMRLRADLQVDGEVLRAHLPETSPFGRPHAASQAPDFKRALQRLDAVERLVATSPARDRIARRRAALSQQMSAYRAVPMQTADEQAKHGQVAWRDAVAKAIEANWDAIPGEHRAGALRLLAETGDTGRTGKVRPLASASGVSDAGVLAECDAVAAFAAANAGEDATKKGTALAAWAAKHAETDASVCLSAFAGCAGSHPGLTAAQSQPYLERWGGSADAGTPGTK